MAVLSPTFADLVADGDSPKVLRHTRHVIGEPAQTPSKGANQARWPEAIVLTVALWLFVLLLFLPIIIARYEGNSWSSVLLDCSTIPVSMLIAMPTFWVFRHTLDLMIGKRIVIMILSVIAAAVVNTAFDFAFQTTVANQIDNFIARLPSDIARFYPSLLNYVLVYGVNMALFQVSYARRSGLRQQLALSRALAAAQQAQLAALRYQLNPHFLFNSLNSISALIVTGRNADAESMTDKLSSFLRSSLNADPGELIPLDEELALTEEYLDIESVRFGERLEVDVDCSPGACVALIPSFLVQPLVENAIKHGVARTRDPTRIEINGAIEGDALKIRVANCVTDAPAGTKTTSAGVGLANVRNRIEAVYGKAATLSAGVEDGRYIATISIPVPRTPQEA